MSWLLPCGRLVPLAMAGLLLEGCWCEGCGDAGPRSSPPLLELSSSLPEELSESEELLPLLLLICSIMSTSALSSLLMSSSCGSGEGLSFKGEVLGPTGGFIGALNGIGGGGGGGGGGGCDGCGGRVGCCSIRAWILLLPSALVFLT